MPDDADITPAVLLQHMQAMEGRLMHKIDTVDQKVEHLEVRMDRMDAKMDRMERNLTNQIDAIDKRLDEIEIELLPKRVKALERAVGI